MISCSLYLCSEQDREMLSIILRVFFFAGLPRSVETRKKTEWCFRGVTRGSSESLRRARGQVAF